MGSIYFHITVALITGIYLSGNISSENVILFITALAVTVTFKKIVLKKNILLCTIIPTVAAIGIILGNAALCKNTAAFSELSEKYAEIHGQIIEIPEYSDNLSTYTVKVKRISYLDHEYTPDEKIMVTSEEKFRFGESVIVKGFIEQIDDKHNGNDFDYRRYYKGKGLVYWVYAEEMIKDSTRYKNFSVNFYINKLKNAIAEQIYKRYEGDEAAILIAVTTGYKKAFSEDMEDALRKSNTTRLFYPANVHLSLLAMLIGLFGSYVRKRKRDIVLIILMILYTVYNIDSSFIVKTALLATLILYEKNKSDYADFMEMLSVVVGILVLTNPLTAFDTGFVLSVTANVIVHYFMPVASRLLIKIRNSNLRGIISIWIVMSVGILPMQIFYFGFTTPFSLFINFLSMPLLVLLALISPFCAVPPFSWAVKGLLRIMLELPEVVSRLPGYRINLPNTGISGVIILYLLFYIFYRRVYKWRSHDYSVKIAVAVISGFILSMAVNIGFRLNKLEIDFVNVNQGDGTVLSIPFKETVIIDGGGKTVLSEYNYGKEVFLPYLKRSGHNAIDVAVVSHFHEDHCLGVIAAMEELTVRDVIISDSLPGNELREKIERLAKEKGINLVYCKAGMRLKFKSGMTMEFISPDDVDLKSEDENDTSFGIRVEYGEFSAIFTGDISEFTESRHKGEWSDCDLLKVAHHGSANSTSELFIQETKPELAVISLGKDNPYSFPRDRVLDVLENYGATVYRTDINGDIRVFADKDGKYTADAYKVK